jgi:hypothetical protein
LNTSTGKRLNFVEAKYSHGNWFGKISHMDYGGSYYGVAHVGYSIDLGGANLSVSVGKLYPSGFSVNKTKVSVELKIPFGSKTTGSAKKSSQGTKDLKGRTFGDFNYLENIPGTA